MKEFVALAICALVLIAAVVGASQRSKKGEAEMGGKPSERTDRSEV